MKEKEGREGEEIIRLVRERSPGELAKDMDATEQMAAFRVKQGGIAGGHRLSEGDLVLAGKGRGSAAGGLSIVAVDGSGGGEFTIRERGAQRGAPLDPEAEEGVVVGLMRKF